MNISAISASRRGFTLIELMVTVAIIAILAAVAYPSYTQYIVRANRAAAEGYLLEITSMQQRFLLDARAYAPDLATLNTTVPANVSGNYDITTPLKAGTGFTATATPKGAQATNDTKCGTLTIDEAGAKGASGDVSVCWQR